MLKSQGWGFRPGSVSILRVWARECHNLEGLGQDVPQGWGLWPRSTSRLRIRAWVCPKIECLDHTSETCIRTGCQNLLARIPLIETLYNFDIFRICASSLTGNTSNNDIFICNYSPQPFRSDNPALLRNEGGCFYCKKKRPIKKLTDLEILDKTIVAEIKIKQKKFFFVPSYRHPNQTLDEVNLYMQNLENIYEIINKENHAATIICGDYNATSTLVWIKVMSLSQTFSREQIY